MVQQKCLCTLLYVWKVPCCVCRAHRPFGLAPPSPTPRAPPPFSTKQRTTDNNVSARRRRLTLFLSLRGIYSRILSNTCVWWLPPGVVSRTPETLQEVWFVRQRLAPSRHWGGAVWPFGTAFYRNSQRCIYTQFLSRNQNTPHPPLISMNEHRRRLRKSAPKNCS